MRLCLPLLALAFASIVTWSSAAPLTVGEPAPLVSGISETGAPVDFGQTYKQQKYTLVYFYPKAFTGGCTAQGCSLRDAYETLTQKGVAVIGVSTDDVDTQKRFKETNHFPFTLIADTDQKVIKAFGQPGVKTAVRQAYLVKDGKIVYADYKGSTKKQADDILEFIAKDGGS